MATQAQQRECDLDGCRFELEVPEVLACWPGHFPGWLVVPGALQLQWVLELAARWLGHPISLVRIERVKFTSPIGPRQRLEVSLARRSDHGFAFRVNDAERVFSSGLLEFAARGSGEAVR